MKNVEKVEIPLVLRMDAVGRLKLPKDILKKLNSNAVCATWDGDVLRLERVPRFRELIGILPGLDMEEFMRERNEDWNCHPWPADVAKPRR